MDWYTFIANLLEIVYEINSLYILHISIHWLTKIFPRKYTFKSPSKYISKPNTFNIKNQQEPKFCNVLYFLHCDSIQSRLSNTVRILGHISGSSSMQSSVIWNAATTCFFAYTSSSNARFINLLPWTHFQWLNSWMYIKPIPIPWAIFNHVVHVSGVKELEGLGLLTIFNIMEKTSSLQCSQIMMVTYYNSH